jgi:hypothetical protein
MFTAIAERGADQRNGSSRWDVVMAWLVARKTLAALCSSCKEGTCGSFLEDPVRGSAVKCVAPDAQRMDRSVANPVG